MANIYNDINTFIHKFPYGVIVLLEDNTVVHSVGYPQPPTQEDIESLRTEIATDATLRLTEIGNYHIVPLEGTEWVKYLSKFMNGE